MQAKDPVCGMMVDTERPAARGTYDGREVVFCSVGCRVAFEKGRASRKT
jgi:YHS domain-containing protein